MLGAVDKISVWLAIESPSHHAVGVNQMMDGVEHEVTGMPIVVERIPGREGLGDVLILRAGPENSQAPIIVLSHLDTVHPLGTVMDQLPVRIEGDRLYGPGVYDMKGGAWLALQAFKQVAASGTANRPIVYLFTPDEEIGSPTSRELIEATAKGSIAALVTEPARMGGRIVTSRKGSGRFQVSLQGKQAHAGMHHEKGRSAIREAAHQILAIEALTDYARGITTCVGVIRGGLAPNVVPENVSFSVDCRVTTIEDSLFIEKTLLGLKAHDPEIKINVDGRMGRPPYGKSKEVASLFATAQSIAAEVGFDLKDCPMTGGASDGNFTAAIGVPTLDGLGIDGDGAHTFEEYCLISSIAPRKELLKGLLTSL